MQQNLEHLLDRLRQAIHAALIESPAVAAAKEELEHTGHVLSISLGITKRNEGENTVHKNEEFPSVERVTRGGSLIQNVADERFLQDIGIASLAE